MEKAIKDDPNSKCDTKLTEGKTDQVADVLLDIVEDEYSKEIEHVSLLDNKAGIIITILLSVLTVSIPNIPFVKIRILINSDYSEYIQFGWLLVLLLIISFGCFVVSILFLYRTVQIKEYKRFGIKDINYRDTINTSIEKTKEEVFKSYQECLVANHETNEKKSYAMKNGIVFCVYGFTFLILCLLVMYVFL